ncbi:hypothetical protein N7467_001134 [Penicillium canescens]|nr:hypothetical protein N7467_001134 [Penicillium canescens]
MGDYSKKMRGQVTAVVSAALQSTTLPAAGCGSLKTAESSVAVGPKYFPMDANAVTALAVYRRRGGEAEVEAQTQRRRNRVNSRKE